MKKIFAYAFATLAILSGFAACTSDESDDTSPGGGKHAGVEKTFFGRHADGQTRTAPGEATAASVPLVWSAGDYIWVDDQRSGELEEGGAEGTFLVREATEGDTYRIRYNMTGGSPDAAFVKPVQAQQGEKINLGANGDFGYAQSTADATFTLAHATSYVWFDTWSSDYTGKLVSITLESADDAKTIAGKAVFDGSGFGGHTEASNSVTLDIAGGISLAATAGGMQPRAAMVLYPADLSATDVYLTYTFEDGSVYLDKKSGIDLKAGRTYRITTKIDPSVPGMLALATAQDEPVCLKYGQSIRIGIEASGWLPGLTTSLPAGWDIDVSYGGGYIDIAIPAAYTEGMDIEGDISIASGAGNILYSVYLLDYTNPHGTFVVVEGNMTTHNGTLMYYDKLGKEYADVFDAANGGKEIGNVVQDIYIANGKIYLLTQNGDSMGGAGRFVVCDAHTLVMEAADPMIIMTPEGKATWPQHLIVVSPTKAYVQYSSSDMESTSGICAVTLKDGKTVVSKKTIDGTFGTFTSVGATKARMIYSRGKIYAACGHGAVIIDPATDAVVKKIDFEGRQAKDIVKAADGNLYIALASTYTGTSPNMGTINGNPKIVGIDHAGNIVSEKELTGGVQFPIEAWSPNIGMCADFNGPYLYFRDSKAFSITTVSRYNYQTQTLEYNYLSGSDTIYGILGVHPSTGQLWVPKSTYTDSDIYVYDVSGTVAVEKYHFHYSSMKRASPAGIDFAYRFGSEWINK